VALRPDPSAPCASVVVPAYHSDATIGRLLDGLRAQTFGDFELIVVNSSQEGRTEQIVRENLPEARFEQSRRRLLPHAARNRGVEVARGLLLAFTDPDCVPEPTWLERLVAASDRGHGLVVGAMDLLDTSAYARAVHLCKFAHWLPGASEGHRTIAPTARRAPSCTSAASAGRTLRGSALPRAAIPEAGRRRGSSGCRPFRSSSSSG